MKGMNFFLKGCLVTGVALVAVGSAVTAFDYARTLWGARSSASPQAVQELEEMRGAALEGAKLRSLDIELSGGRLQLSAGEEVMLQVGEKLQPHIKYEQKGDSLFLRDTLNEKWWKRVHDWEDTDYAITLVLPEGEYERVYISLGCGEGYIQGLTADSLTVYSGAGDMYLKEISAQDIELSGGVGEFTAYALSSSRSVDIGCGVGTFTLAGDLRGDISVSGGIGEMSLRLAGEEEEYSVFASAGVGSVRVGSRTVSMLSGGIEEERKNAENRLDISCGVGEIDVQFSEDIDKPVS